MDNDKLLGLLKKVVSLLVILVVIAAVLYFAVTKLNKLEFAPQTSESVVANQDNTSAAEPTVLSAESSEDFTRSTNYSDSTTDILFIGDNGDYAVLMSVDSVLMTAVMTNMDTNVPVLYKDTLSTTIKQAASLDDSTLKKICLAAFGRDKIDYTIRLNEPATKDLVAYMKEEEKKVAINMDIFTGSDLGTILVDELVDFANSEYLSFESLSHLWSDLTANSNTSLTFNKLSEIVMGLKTYSIKRNWEKFMFDTYLIEEEPVEETLNEEPIEEFAAEPVTEVPSTFSFTSESLLKSLHGTSISAQDITKPAQQEQPAEPAPVVISEPVVEPIKIEEPVASTTEKTKPLYTSLSAGYGYSFSRENSEKYWERDLSVRLELGKRVFKHVNLFSSLRVLRSTPIDINSVFNATPNSYTVIPGVGFGLAFEHFGINAEFNGNFIITELDFNAITPRLGATLTPYLKVPFTRGLSMNINAPVNISVRGADYKLSTNLTLGLEYIGR